MTVGRAMQDMTAVEYAGWQHHFKRYPPGDFYVQTICAVIGATLLNVFSQTPCSPYDLAPWLAPPQEHDGPERREQAARVRAVATAYRRTRT